MDASEQIDKQIAELQDWRGELVKHLRKLINEADARLIEEWKWGTAGWSYKGMVCALGVFKDHVKVNFFKGAMLSDPDKLFNAGLEAKTSRGIDLKEGDVLDEKALMNLVREAVAFNEGK
jgi:hypothetical protein